MFLFGLRGVAADGADVEVAGLANPGILLSGNQQGNGLGIEAGVGLLGFQGSMEGADGGGVLALRGLFEEAGVHGVDLVLLAVEGGLEVFQGGFHFDRVDLAFGVAAHECR